MARPKKKAYQSVKDCHCMSCGHDLPIAELYYVGDKGGNYTNEGYLPYCRSCCDMICEDYLKETKSAEAAVYYTCAINDVPFMKSVFESMESYIDSKSIKAPKYFKLYMNQYLLARNKKAWKATRFADSDVALGDVKKLQKNDLALKQEEEKLELDWGKQEDYDDYSFLELKFETYVEGLTLTPSLEQTVRYLCLAELEVRKLKNANQDSKNAETKVMDYYKKLGLDKFKNDKNMSNDEKFLEARIAIMEQKKPAEYYEDKKRYADFCHFEKYGDDHLRRPIKNMLLGQKEYHIKKDDE